MSAQPKKRYTLEEYLELDKNSDERLEYWDGEIFSMSGVSDEHDQIEGNLYLLLRSRLDDRNCRAFLANISRSTEAYDRGDKFTNYKSIPSFREYLLAAQHRPHITQFIKRNDGEWIH